MLTFIFFLTLWFICGSFAVYIHYRFGDGKRTEYISVWWAGFLLTGGLITFLLEFTDSKPFGPMNYIKNPWRR